MISNSELIVAVQDSTCVSQVIDKLGRARVGTNYKLIRYKIAVLGINISHWGGVPPKLKRSNDEMFTSESNVSRIVVRNRILNYNIIPYMCQICGSPPEWNGIKLTLVLDHINGIRNDHRLENMRFLCPNCNSQTDTFSGKNKIHDRTRTKYNTCDCGKVKLSSSKTCKQCAISKLQLAAVRHRKEKIIWPERNDLEKMIEDYGSYLQVAKALGVSDNAVRKRLRNH